MRTNARVFEYETNDDDDIDCETTPLSLFPERRVDGIVVRKEETKGRQTDTRRRREG